MSLTLNNLKPNKGATKKRKRIGRGNASGHGTYSTRGQKGQKSRSGVTGLKRLGMKKMLLSVPKKRGFTSLKPKNQAVNLDDLNNNFTDGALVNNKSLLKAGLISKISEPIKILGRGELTVKNLRLQKLIISKSAEEQLIKNNCVIK